MNNKELKKKEYLFEIVDDLVNGMDIYNHNGSFWLINTKELKWMIEFTKDKTLWYNYNIFKSLFKAMSLDVMENQVYITEWFELRFLKPEVVEDTIQNGVKHTQCESLGSIHNVDDTIQNGVKINGIYVGGKRQKENVDVVIDYGVKETYDDCSNNIARVEGIVRIGGVIKNGIKEVQPLPAQDGVKHTKNQKLNDLSVVEDTIQNGVKRTLPESIPDSFGINDTIQNGVKRTNMDRWNGRYTIDNTIKNGVKEILSLRLPLSGQVEDVIENGVEHIFPKSNPTTWTIENTIQNGVKHTEDGDWLDGDERIKDIIQGGVKETIGTRRRTLLGVDDIIKNGVKEVQPLPAQDGNMDWGNYYHNKEDRTKPFNDYIKDTIKYGIKK